MKNIVIRGAGGCARDLACIIELINKSTPTWNILGLIEYKENIGQMHYGYPVIGDDTWFKNVDNIHCAIAIGNPEVRKKVRNDLREYNIIYPNIIDPTAVIAKDCILGEGNMILGSTRLGPGSRMGDFCLLVGSCVIGHDSTVGNYVDIMNFASVLRGVQVSDMAMINTGATVLQNTKVGTSATVGAGTVVIKDVPANNTVFGVPARTIFSKD